MFSFVIESKPSLMTTPTVIPGFLICCLQISFKKEGDKSRKNTRVSQVNYKIHVYYIAIYSHICYPHPQQKKPELLLHGQLFLQFIDIITTNLAYLPQLYKNVFIFTMQQY